MSQNPYHEEIAVIGMSCRTAGGIDTPEKLWAFLLDKRNASGEIPPQRWEPWRHRDPRNSKILDSIIRKGYFLDNLEHFDAAFFGISPKEAALMDPHQRLALELTWEALENAGINLKALVGSDTAVFMGVDSDDYSRMLIEDLPNIEAWSGIGTAAHGIPNRISYHLDLKGPSAAVDAACASSLVAIHLASQAIRSGESTVAICGGVNVICAPGLTHMLQKAGALSPDGICRSFDDGACGYARGEGGAIVILKRLAAAMADGDHVFAVLKGSASAQDGKTDGIKAPNGSAQENVARKALANAGHVDPLTIAYVEAHATSTALGDPTEIRAIANVYGMGRQKNCPCFVGSLKPNIGHLEAAAGAIGFVKAVLSVHKGTIAPQALLEKLNTKIDWTKSGLEVSTEKEDWPAPMGNGNVPRRAAICCYGYGGSVCHAIIEQAPEVADSQLDNESSTTDNASIILVISAQQERRRIHQASNLAKWLEADRGAEPLRSIARTLCQRRAIHDYRTSFVVADHKDAIEALNLFVDGRSHVWTTSNRITGGKKDVVWVYSGHGAQWAQMGKDLVHNVVFHSAIADVEPVIQREANFSAIEALTNCDLGGSDRIQILTYVMQIGLTAVLRSKGIEPQAIIGHSVGELAAAVFAGCLTPIEGAVIVTRRAKLYKRVQGQGAMALVSLSMKEVQNELGRRMDLVAAISSSPSTCVVSGETAAVEAYMALAQERGVKTWRVQTDVGFHSPMLECLADPLRIALDNVLDPRPAKVPLYSTTDNDARSQCLGGPEYWVNNMVGCVRLNEAVNAALNDGYQIFMEVSSHPIVSHSIAETIGARSIENAVAFGIMNKDSPTDRSISHAVSRLFTSGAKVDFYKQLGVGSWSRAVPNTPWIHKSYWKTFPDIQLASPLNRDVDSHTLLGSLTDVAGSNTKIWTTVLDETTKPYPLTHILDETEIVPAAVYCTTFQHATGATVLDDVQLKVPTPMSSDKRDVQVVLRDGKVKLFSRLQVAHQHGDSAISEHSWIEHSSANARSIDMVPYEQEYSVPQLKCRISNVLPTNFAWNYLQHIGVRGIAYPWAVLSHQGDEHEMLVHVDMSPNSDILEWNKSSWAPFLDAATSIGSSIFFENIRLRIVSGIDRVLFVSADIPPKVGWLLIMNSTQGDSLKADISILSETGILLVKLLGMRFSDVETEHETRRGIDGLVHRLAWVPPQFAGTPLGLENIVIVSNTLSVFEQFRAAVKSAECRVTHVTSPARLNDTDVSSTLSRPSSVVLYVPDDIDELEDVPRGALEGVWTATQILRILANPKPQPKLFVVTYRDKPITAIAHAPLHGFARIAASEYDEAWGGLIDCEEREIPLLALRFVQGHAIIRMQTGLSFVPRLRPFKTLQQHRGTVKSLLPKQHGTYLVTGGFGDLGLEVLHFLVKKGARRIVVLSRRGLVPRKEWASNTNTEMSAIIKEVLELESNGASIHSVAIDIGSPQAYEALRARLEDFPPVLGVIHAAGVSIDGFIKNTTQEQFTKVISPKVQGALTLHKLFPSKSIDFMILFSSVGQLLGTPGQAAYASANAFLDGLATMRRAEGCTCVAIQWTAWRDMGMARDNNILELELHSQGVTSISSSEAFQAWEHISKYDTDHAVVTRTRILDADETLPCSLVADIVQRRKPALPVPGLSSDSSSSVPSISAPQTPRSGPELEAHLRSEIRTCLSVILHLDAEEIDDHAAIADLGVDSIMTVALRQQLQKTLGVKVPPTLTWSHPTVVHLAGWYQERPAQ